LEEKACVLEQRMIVRKPLKLNSTWVQFGRMKLIEINWRNK